MTKTTTRTRTTKATTHTTTVVYEVRGAAFRTPSSSVTHKTKDDDTSIALIFYSKAYFVSIGIGWLGRRGGGGR